jgi:hypothetical protein
MSAIAHRLAGGAAFDRQDARGAGTTGQGNDGGL